MSFSNYPNGFANGLTVRGMPIVQAQPGNVFWVNNSSTLADGGISGSNGNKGTYQQPFATIDYAVSRCKAGRGDIVMVMPGHQETISSATALGIDVAGVAVIGLGVGSSRPKIIFDTAVTTTIAVSAANVTIKNLVFSANFADINEAFTPTARNIVFEDCEFTQEATNMNFLSLADTSTTDNQADGLSFIRCRWVEPDTATLAVASLDGDIDRFTVEDCYFHLGVNSNDLPIYGISAAGKDTTNVRILRNIAIRLNDANPLFLTNNTTTANTGVIAHNITRHLDTAGELLVTAGTNILFSDNRSSAVADASGFLVPAADS